MVQRIKIIFPIILLLITQNVWTQYTEKEISVKTLVPQRSIYLNGGIRASLGGKSRVTVPIDLPNNTVEWYYSFTTSPGESGTKVLNLALQLSSLLVDQSGTTASLLKQVEIPMGSNSVDIYLVDSENRTPFIEKWDNNGGTFYYNIEGSTKNTKQATVIVDDIIRGRQYLGLKNPSSSEGVNIFIEVIAIVETEVYVDEWTMESKSEIKSSCLETFNTQNPGREEVCQCMTAKITSAYTPSQMSQLTEASIEKTALAEIDNCYAETDNLQLKQAESDYLEKIRKEKEELERNLATIDKIVKESKAAATLGNLVEARKKMLSAINLVMENEKVRSTYTEKWIANSYNDAVWWSILLNELDKTEEYLQKGLAFDSSNMYLKSNLGFFHLLKGNYKEAEKVFLSYRRRAWFPDGRKWVKVIEEDLLLLEDKGMGNADFDRIRESLKIK